MLVVIMNYEGDFWQYVLMQGAVGVLQGYVDGSGGEDGQVNNENGRNQSAEGMG